MKVGDLFNCKQCGLETINKHRTINRIFCSRKCACEWQSIASKITRVCKSCGKEFIRDKGNLTPKNALLFCSTKCQGLSKLGSKNPNFKGGEWLTNQGYVEIRVDGKVYRKCRYIMEQHIGRPLYKDENVHHLNGVRDDDRIENLELWSSSQPCGQRVVDKIAWAKEILERYGTMHDRDINAAKNILSLGHQRLAVGIPVL